MHLSSRPALAAALLLAALLCCPRPAAAQVPTVDAGVAPVAEPDQPVPPDAGVAPVTGPDAAAEAPDTARKAGIDTGAPETGSDAGVETGTTETGAPGIDVGTEPPPQPWNDWIVTGELIDDLETVRSFLAPAMLARTALTREARSDLEKVCAHLGYHLTDLRLEHHSDGRVIAVLELHPVTMVRSVVVSLGNIVDSFLGVFFISSDEVRRRLRLRPGAALAPVSSGRDKQLAEEEARVESYLRDEGYFEATADVTVEEGNQHDAAVKVRLDLGRRYTVGRINVTGNDDVPDDSTIANHFRHKRFCFVSWCTGDARFTRDQLNKDIAEVVKMYKRRGFPGVRVRTDFDPARSFQRLSKTVSFTVLIQERRKLDVVFEGNDKGRFPDEKLTEQLTFQAEGSYDDIEMQSSAAAIRTYYQSRGYFEVSVTGRREPFRSFERIIYTIDEGPVLRVRARTFTGNRAISSDELAAAVQIKPFQSTFLGSTLNVSSALLAADTERILELYRSRGYLQAEVDARVVRDRRVLDNAAALAGLVAAGTRSTDLYVRFDIREGEVTSVQEVRLAFDPREHETKEEELRGVLEVAAGAPFVPARIDADREALVHYLTARGRAQARVATTVVDGARGKVVVHTVTENPVVRFKNLIIRGNFRTADWVIREELGLRPGQRITDEAYESGQSDLRSTGMFNAVKVELSDGVHPVDGNVVARVEERYDHFAETEFSLGYSSDTKAFAQLGLIVPNLPSKPKWFGGRPWNGIGLRLELQAIWGFELTSYEGRLRAPRWIARKVTGLSFDTEASALYRVDVTQRFGDLTIYGASLVVSKSLRRRALRGLSLALRYDFRQRNRDVDLVRPAGESGDITTNPLRTRTGSVGVAAILDRRADRRGLLNPLVPQSGFKLEARASYASPYLLGQDSFIKVGGSGQYFYSPANRVQLMAGLRYDQGIPLGGAALLPEVERFFAGGDTTVRGFDEDRLAVEVIQAPVPPLGEVSQLRIIPAGGTIRAINNLDLQVQLWELFDIPVASAIFLDSGIVTNSFDHFQIGDLRHAVGVALFRLVAPFGALSAEYAVPLDPHLGDDPRGRFHLNFGVMF